MIAFAPLAGGRLTGKYQTGIPAGSRAGYDPRFLKPAMLTDALRECVAALSFLALSKEELRKIDEALALYRA